MQLSPCQSVLGKLMPLQRDFESTQLAVCQDPHPSKQCHVMACRVSTVQQLCSRDGVLRAVACYKPDSIYKDK